MKVVEVKWHDAYTSSGWQLLEEHRNDPTADITSVGYLVERDDQWLRLSSAFDGQKERKYGDLTNIPAQAIRSVKVLRK